MKEQIQKLLDEDKVAAWLHGDVLGGRGELGAQGGAGAHPGILSPK